MNSKRQLKPDAAPGALKPGRMHHDPIEEPPSGKKGFYSVPFAISRLTSRSTEMQSKAADALAEHKKYASNWSFAVNAIFSNEGFVPLSAVVVRAALDKAGHPESKAIAAQILAEIESPAGAGLIRKMLEYAKENTAQMPAMKIWAIKAAGKTGDASLIQLLLPIYNNPTEQQQNRDAAWASISQILRA